MNEDVKRLLYSAVFGLLMVGTVVGSVGEPTNWKGWVGLVASTIITCYAKYSTSTNLLMPNREVWTEEKRAAELLKKS